MPKSTEEVKKETSSGTCSKSLFPPTVSIKSTQVEKNKDGAGEVNQIVEADISTIGLNAKKELVAKVNLKEVEEVAESLGTVAISKQFHTGESSNPKPGVATAKKWTRKKAPTVPRKPRQSAKAKELGKRALIEVVVMEDGSEEVRNGEKKQKGNVVMVDIRDKEKEVMLDDQHHRAQ